jgi:hypothetical protein
MQVNLTVVLVACSFQPHLAATLATALVLFAQYRYFDHRNLIENAPDDRQDEFGDGLAWLCSRLVDELDSRFTNSI